MICMLFAGHVEACANQHGDADLLADLINPDLRRRDVSYCLRRERARPNRSPLAVTRTCA